jgi:hypothetical protein
LILAITAFAENLRPIISIINSQKRVAGVLTAPEQAADLIEGLKPYKKFVFVSFAIYLPAILFFLYIIAAKTMTILNIKMPRFILPIAALINTVLLFIVLFTVDNIGGGLGLVSEHETAANYYSWYAAPVFESGSNIYYYAPTFHTVIMPLLFLGILPLFYGIKQAIREKKVAKKPYED